MSCKKRKLDKVGALMVIMKDGAEVSADPVEIKKN